MVEKAKNASKKTVKIVDELIEFTVYGSMIAAAIKLASQPAVHTRYYQVPVWQFVAVVLLACVVYLVRKNRSK